MTIEQIARVAYAANRQYAKAIGERPPRWDDASPVDRKIWLWAIEYMIKYVFTSHETDHEMWMSFESTAGWSWGPVLDNEAKQHPHHVPWHQLEPAQRRKVVLCRAIVQSFL